MLTIAGGIIIAVFGLAVIVTVFQAIDDWLSNREERKRRKKERDPYTTTQMRVIDWIAGGALVAIPVALYLAA